MTRLQLLAASLAAQAETAAEDYGADAWCAATAGALTAAAALSADIEEEKEEKEQRRQRDWLDRLRELVGLPSRR